jgi:hypothetical protein
MTKPTGLPEKYVGSDKLYMAGDFANLGDALKQTFSSSLFDKMIKEEAPFRKAIREAEGIFPETLAVQLAALLGECPEVFDDGELGYPVDAIDWMADVLERKQVRRKQLDAWRDGTLAEYEAKRAKRRKAHRGSVSPFGTDHPSTDRTPRKAQQPRGRPRVRARSSIQSR